MGWGNYLVKSSDRRLLDDYLADFIGDPVARLTGRPRSTTSTRGHRR